MLEMDDILSELVERMKKQFIENYDVTKNSIDRINDYLTTIGIISKYGYSDFCSEFLNETEKYITSLNDKHLNGEHIINIDTVYIISIIMSNMVKHKINTTVDDEDERNSQLVLHDIRMSTLVGDINF